MAKQSDKEFLIRVRADIQQALGDLKKLPGVVGDTGKKAKQAGQDLGSMERGLQGITRAALAYISVRSFAYIVKQADAFNVLSVRIKTATRDTGDYVQMQRQLYSITQQTGVEFSTTVSLFQSLARSKGELQATNDEMLKLTKLVEQLGVISGATKASQQAGLLQFSQGLSAGVFRAEEFNSLLENLPELASRIAKGLGKTPGELRKAVIEGRVLSKDVFDALLKQSEDINNQFKEIPNSVERSATKMSTAFSRMLSVIDGATGATKIIAEGFERAANNMDYIADRMNETELDEAMRKRAKVGLDYVNLIEDGMSKESAMAKILLQQMDELDAKIIRINKAMLKADPDAGTGNQSAQEKPEPIKVNDEQESIDKLIASLEQERDTFGKTREEIALYKLELLGATEPELKTASAIIATTQAKRDHDAAMAEGKRIYEETRTEQEKLSNEMGKLNLLYQQGAFGAVGSAEAMDTLGRAMLDVTDKFEDIEEEGTNSFDALTAAARGWGDEFTTTLAEMVQQGKLDFSSLVDSIISDLLRIMIYQSITAPIFGSLGIPGFSASVQHAGGFAGTGPQRTVNPFVFAGAKRYHNGGFPGLSSDEVPAILQKGELVLSKDQVAGATGGGGGSLHVEIVNKGAPAKATEASASTDIDRTIIRVTLDDINRGGPLRAAIKNVSKE